MSNKNNDERSQSNLSSHSEDKFNLPKSRLSSASKNNEEDHFPISLHNNHNDSSRNSPNQHKNESRHDSHSEDEDQPSMNDSLSHINQPSNDGPLDNHSYTLSHEHISNHFHDKHDIDHTNNQNLDNSQHLSDSSSHNQDRRKRENIPHESKADEKISKETKSKIPHPSCTFRSEGVAGNGALMRLTPVPLFFFRNKYAAVEFSGRSGEITHGDKKAYDACRYYGALIVAALHGFTKDQILARNFYSAHRHWFGEESLHEDIQSIAEGSFKNKEGHEGGIAGKGYIVKALEAALWAFWSDGGSFEKGACAAVNLGDDTDTTAAIYGQLAGAYYGFKELPKEWIKQVCARKYLENISKWIAYEGDQWEHGRINSARSHK
ncbi:hypothetical protein I4U23_027062 [Adineta vaga]|nr:hypothetical protein I4U23_027062 [Adineta vaga]